MRRFAPVGLRSADPFQLAMLLIGIVRGVSYMTGFLPASLAEQALPHWALILCLTELAVGSCVTLSAVIWGNVQLQKRGLALLGPSAALYAGILLYERPHSAFLSFVIYGALAGACLMKRWQIHRVTSILRDARGEVQ